MNKQSYVGVINKIRVIKSFPDMLVRFTLRTQSENINCLVSRKELANLILFLEEEKHELSIFGHYNIRKQFVIEKFIVRNPNQFILEYVVKPLSNIA